MRKTFAGTVLFLSLTFAPTYAYCSSAQSNPESIETIETIKGGNIAINFYPQDPVASELEQIKIPADWLTNGHLDSARFAVDDYRVTRSNRPYPIAKQEQENTLLYDPTDLRFDQVQSYVVAILTLKMWEKYAGRNLDWQWAPPYSFDNKLTLVPHFNNVSAGYNRGEGQVRLFFIQDPRLDKLIQASQSLEIVAHEIGGHAILDGWKPEYNSTMTGNAFIESLGDLSAMLLSLHSSQVLDRVLRDTQGNIRKSNVVTRQGEEMSYAFAIIGGIPPEKAKDYIERDAANSFSLGDPIEDNSHNFSQLFSGAVWDLICEMYEKQLLKGETAKTALIQARDEVGALLARTIDLAPSQLYSYQPLAEAMLRADQEYSGGKYQETILKVMVSRKIFTPPKSFTPQKPLEMP